MNGVDRDVGSMPAWITSGPRVTSRVRAHHHGSRRVEAHRLVHHLPRVRQRLSLRLAKQGPLRHSLNLLDDPLRDVRMQAQQIEGPRQRESCGPWPATRNVSRLSTTSRSLIERPVSGSVIARRRATRSLRA